MGDGASKPTSRGQAQGSQGTTQGQGQTQAQQFSERKSTNAVTAVDPDPGDTYDKGLDVDYSGTSPTTRSDREGGVFI